MTIHARLKKLERIRPSRSLSPPLDLVGLPSDVVARVTLAKAEGTFPQSLCDADLEALVALADQQGEI
tara:strand:- start:1686 stop:1889 length:204 start_codon:yes stop_codon:yes gene_type:complete